MKPEQTIKAKRTALRQELRIAQVRFAKAVNDPNADEMDSIQAQISELIYGIRLIDWVLK